MAKLKVIHPKSEADQAMLRIVDRMGQLVTGASYPTKEQLDSIPADSEDK